MSHQFIYYYFIPCGRCRFCLFCWHQISILSLITSEQDSREYIFVAGSIKSCWFYYSPACLPVNVIWWDRNKCRATKCVVLFIYYYYHSITHPPTDDNLNTIHSTQLHCTTVHFPKEWHEMVSRNWSAPELKYWEGGIQLFRILGTWRGAGRKIEMDFGRCTEQQLLPI